MYLILENTNKTFAFPENQIILVGNDSECEVQINHPKIWGRHFSITHHDYGSVLDVYTDCLLVNGQKIIEKCVLDAGDLLQIDELNFRLLDDEFIPKESQLNQSDLKVSENANTSSVYGVRSFSEESAGQFIIDDFHHPDGWQVLRKDDELHYVDSDHKTLLNGMEISQARLRNGDMISSSSYKFKVELPGTSGFSKFSPSHPRNVLLSESVKPPESSSVQTASAGSVFLKNNLWWLTLLLGLLVLVVIALINPNN